MPVLRPEVSRLLDAASLGTKKEGDFKQMLDESGLSLSETLDSLRNLRDLSESENTKLRVNESVLKMHGVMKDEGSSIPTINIIIADPNAPSINPITLPRELHSIKESIQ